MSRFGRRRIPGEEQRATTLELFYDLVFVFAITQVSHLLLDHLTWEGLGQSLLVLMVVWWSWNYTTWATNELDPASAVVRVVILAVMAASLVMAVAIRRPLEIGRCCSRGARVTQAGPERMAGRDVPFRGALPALRNHRARRIDRLDRGDDLGAGARRSEGRRVRYRLSRVSGVLVALLQLRRGHRNAVSS